MTLSQRLYRIIAGFCDVIDGLVAIYSFGQLQSDLSWRYAVWLVTRQRGKTETSAHSYTR